MSDRPILFSAPMVRAILNSTKTQTRRVAKEFAGRDDLSAILKRFPHQEGCPYGQPGDRLWVRETWRTSQMFDDEKPNDLPHWACLRYEADEKLCGAWAGYGYAGKLRPSIHMPRWASRITLEITGVRVERLQDISEADAIAEGCARNHNGYFWGGPHAVIGLKQMATPKQAYRDLWESINGPGSWDANPWVWVVEFKRAAALTQPEGGA